jgi:hypothetical protein
MEKYHKIQTLFFRDPENNHKTLLEGVYSKPEFEYLENCPWVWTEKVDGTNIRVHYQNGELGFGGRTERSQIPVDLVNYLNDTFDVPMLSSIFADDANVTIYGEGYGNKIQKVGSRYLCDHVGLIVFDILINGNWLERDNVEAIALSLELPVVPIIQTGTLTEAVSFVKAGAYSQVAENDKDMLMEGLIMRPEQELLNRNGKRIITKLKHKDFPQGE